MVADLSNTRRLMLGMMQSHCLILNSIARAVPTVPFISSHAASLQLSVREQEWIQARLL
jgi:hypothetical protein